MLFKISVSRIKKEIREGAKGADATLVRFHLPRLLLLLLLLTLSDLAVTCSVSNSQSFLSKSIYKVFRLKNIGILKGLVKWHTQESKSPQI